MRPATPCVPVVRHVRADLDTPLSAYLTLVDGTDAHLLESVEGSDTRGAIRSSACWRREFIEVRGRQWRRLLDGVCVEEREVADPLAEVQALIHSEVRCRCRKVCLPSPAAGSAISPLRPGSHRETSWRRDDRPDQLGTPEIVLLRTEELAVFDNRKGRLSLMIVHAATDDWRHRTGRAPAGSTHLWPAPAPVILKCSTAGTDEAHFVSGFTREEFEAAVAARSILAGDAFQIVISQRLSVPSGHVHRCSTARCVRSTCHRTWFRRIWATCMWSARPRRILARLKAGGVVVRPIAGIYLPRGANSAEDDANAQRLLSDPEERAEHPMLIDLGRNDVGRVAQSGTVQLTDQMVVERHSHVMHIVSLWWSASCARN